MKFHCINSENVDDIIISVWDKVKECVENKGCSLSSEKTLVFKFMWELSKFVDEDLLRYDFEYVAYSEKMGGDKFLDLMIWTDANYKIAIEFKFPKKSDNGNSNQTETRRKVYKDISRLEYLVKNNINEIKKGYFLFACNEEAYVNKGNKSRYTELMVHHNYKYLGTLKDEYDDIGMLTSSFTFTWDNIKKSNNNYSIIGNYAWLKPITISRSNNI